MKKRGKIIFLLATLIFSLVVSSLVYAQTSAPVIFFSDITSGPKTGLGDGLGEGAIVTVWGKNLGSSQGASKVYFKDSLDNIHEAAHIYYWKNADRNKPGGPANLYESHGMQEIAFSIPSAAVDGLGKIYIQVNDQNSNELDFTIRDGKIYFVKTTGNNANNGSWNNPWQTLDYVGERAGRKIQAGDTIYACDEIQETDGFDVGVGVRDIDGTVDRPISVIAYPGARVLAQGRFGIRNYYSYSEYWNFAKFVVKTNTTGIYTFKGMRAVGNEITNYPSGCADGMSGSVAGGNLEGRDTVGGVKVLGNYIHDYGCDTTSGKHHTFYISNRGGFSSESYELGWNYLKGSKAPYGLHVYDENTCGDFTGTMRIHDNVVIDQRGPCVDIVTEPDSANIDPCFSMDVEVYNNILINCGIGYSRGDAVYIGGSNNRANIKFYNNVFYGYNESAIVNEGSQGTFAGTWEWKNNIVVDTKNKPYLHPTSYDSSANPFTTNNIWYNGGDGNPASPPSWDTNPITSSPLFVNPSVLDFHLQETSPAIDVGFNVGSIVSRDLDGNLRPMDGNNDETAEYDIGAYEYTGAYIPPPQPFCGDDSCNGLETCSSCPQDCGDCPQDITPPVISQISNSSITNSSATISWQTNENSNGTLEYGVSLSLGMRVSHSNYLQSHVLQLLSLLSNKTYYYRVKSCDASGNCNSSIILQFKTLEKMPECNDSDADGFNQSAIDCGTADCNDANSGIYPGAIEICGNGIDENCDGNDLACEQPPPSNGGGSSDGGSGTYKPCNENWSCQWGPCQDLTKKWVCRDLNWCNTTKLKSKDEGKTTSCLVESKCKDNDGDGYGEGKGCLGEDIDDNNATLNLKPGTETAQPPKIKLTLKDSLYYGVLFILLVAILIVIIILVKKIILLKKLSVQ